MGKGRKKHDSPPKAGMSACQSLFDYSVRKVSGSDITNFVPDDPGYADYVKTWMPIVTSQKVPACSNFDVTETIGLTQWVDAKRISHPRQFRRFRVFTNSVGMAMDIADQLNRDLLPANYFAINLLADSHALGDVNLLDRLEPAFAEFYIHLSKANSEQAPFLLLAQILVLLLKDDVETASGLVNRLIESETPLSALSSEELLWGWTYFDQLHHRWKDFVRQYLLPGTPDLSLLRDALVADLRS